MKVLVFGDSHLSHHFNQSKFNKMKSLFNSVDKVIINGDFWDSAYWNFDDFVNSKWNGLFSLLKSQKAIYLYGNHDREYMCDDRVYDFSVKQGKVHQFDFNNTTVYVMHGDVQVYGKHWDIMPDFFEKSLWRIGNVIEASLVKKFGKEVLKKQHQHTNDRFKEFKIQKYGIKPIVVYNHTHVQERDDETNSYNTGCMKYGLLQYVIFDTINNTVDFFDETYKL